MGGWGYLTWEMHRDISVAVLLKDQAAETRARDALALCQTACAHTEHPEKPGQCFRCGVDIMVVAKPGMAKTSAPPPQGVPCRRYTG